MARDDDQLKFRVPDGLKARIERSARENSRSMNAEIIATLERQYPLEIPLEDVFNSAIRNFGGLKRKFDADVLFSTLKSLQKDINHQISGALDEDYSEEYLRNLLAKVEIELSKFPSNYEMEGW